MPKYCPNCGAKLAEKTKYCPNCGAKIIEETGVETKPETETTVKSETEINLSKALNAEKTRTTLAKIDCLVLALILILFASALFMPVITEKVQVTGMNATAEVWSYQTKGYENGKNVFELPFVDLWFNYTLLMQPPMEGFKGTMFITLALFVSQVLVILLVSLSLFFGRPKIPFAMIISIAATALMVFLMRHLVNLTSSSTQGTTLTYAIGFYLWVAATTILTITDFVWIALEKEETRTQVKKIALSGIFMIIMWMANAMLTNIVSDFITQNSAESTSFAYTHLDLVTTIINCAVGVGTLAAFFILNDLDDPALELGFGAFSWVIWVFIPGARLSLAILMPLLVGSRERFALKSKNKRLIMFALTLVALTSLCITYFYFIPTTSGKSALFTSTAGVGSAKAQVQIDSMDLVKQSGGVTFSITIKNAGDKSAKSVTVTLAGESAAAITLPSGTLKPNQTVSYTATFSTSDFVVGNAYLITITAEYTDSSTSSIVASVLCGS
jgi:uncharacterized OB-fold protein